MHFSATVLTFARSIGESRYGPTTRGSSPASWAPGSVYVSVVSGSMVAEARAGRAVLGAAESAMVRPVSVVRAIRRPVVRESERTEVCTPFHSACVAAKPLVEAEDVGVVGEHLAAFLLDGPCGGLYGQPGGGAHGEYGDGHGGEEEPYQQAFAPGDAGTGCHDGGPVSL